MLQQTAQPPEPQGLSEKRPRQAQLRGAPTSGPQTPPRRRRRTGSSVRAPVMGHGAHQGTAEVGRPATACTGAALGAPATGHSGHTAAGTGAGEGGPATGRGSHKVAGTGVALREPTTGRGRDAAAKGPPAGTKDNWHSLDTSAGGVLTPPSHRGGAEGRNSSGPRRDSAGGGGANPTGSCRDAAGRGGGICATGLRGEDADGGCSSTQTSA